MTASDTVLLAVIARSLVDATLDGTGAGIDPLPESLDLAQWQAAKFGLRGNHIDPVNGTRTSAAHMMESLIEFILPALQKKGDDQFVKNGLSRALQQGTGSQIQRRHFHEDGFDAVLARARS